MLMTRRRKQLCAEKKRNSNFPFRQENKFIDQNGKCGSIIVPWRKREWQGDSILSQNMKWEFLFWQFFIGEWTECQFKQVEYCYLTCSSHLIFDPPSWSFSLQNRSNRFPSEMTKIFVSSHVLPTAWDFGQDFIGRKSKGGYLFDRNPSSIFF